MTGSLRPLVAGSLVSCAVVVLAAGMPTALAQGPIAREVEMPIEAITLYRSGVGGFVRSAVIDGDATARLTFETDQINDILKSMTVLDFGGGTVGAIAYAADEPLARRLESFGLDISDQPSTTDIFTRIRGTDVRLETGDGQMVGTVLGTESRMVGLPGVEHAQSQSFVNLVTAAGISSIRVSDVRSFEILDDQLADELQQALSALAHHRAERTKAVDLELRGNPGNDRTVGVFYVHEMPVWKMTYRLVLDNTDEPEGEDDAPRGKSTLQGFAIVENTTDADWQAVRLSLAAGRPVSFEMDLYEPVFLDRPDVALPLLAGAPPQMYATSLLDLGGLAEDLHEVNNEPHQTPGRMRILQMTPSVVAPRAMTAETDRMGEALGQSAATASQQGEQFFLTLDQPISLERRQSAMLPVIVDEIQAERLSIYARSNGRHPMRGAKITNTADLTLLPGPIAVYDGASYAGDAVIPHVTAGADQLLSYAVDIDVLAEVDREPQTRVERLRIIDGLLERTNTNTFTTTYTFTNRDQHLDRDLIVEHRPEPRYELAEPEAPDEKADGVLRFRLEISAGEGESLEVVETRQTSSRLELLAVSTEYLGQLRSEGRVSDEVLNAYREAARLNGRIQAAEREIEATEQERREITQDQSRIRDNLARLDRDSTLFLRYTRKLNEQEDRLETIAEELERWREDKADREADLREYLRDLDVS
ncbi:MAG: hypothetical protein AAGI30_12835 [Planctomycetota bacterium]